MIGFHRYIRKAGVRLVGISATTKVQSGHVFMIYKSGRSMMTTRKTNLKMMIMSIETEVAAKVTQMKVTGLPYDAPKKQNCPT